MSNASNLNRRIIRCELLALHWTSNWILAVYYDDYLPFNIIIIWHFRYHWYLVCFITNVFAYSTQLLQKIIILSS